MRAKTIFLEDNPDPRKVLETRMFERSNCRHPDRGLSLQIPEDSRLAASDLSAIATSLQPARIYQLSDRTGDRRATTLVHLGHAVNSDAWWLGEVAFELELAGQQRVLIAPYADGALVFLGVCSTSASLYNDVVQSARALGYELDQ